MSHVHPIDEQIARFVADKEREAGSRWTASFYRTALLSVFLPWARERGLSDGSAVTVEDWNAYVDELRSRDLRIQSVLTYLRGLRIFLGSLDVPIKKFKMPKAPRPMLEILTREEIDTLEACATNERDKLIVRVLANTGIRLGELTGLKPKDLHEIFVPHYYRIRVWGKGSKEREVPIDRPTFKRLESYAKAGGNRAYVFPALQHNRATGELVMLNGPRLSNNAVDKMFGLLKKAARITKPCTPHKLRHAFATHALQHGMAIEKLQQILGHRDLSMILHVYSHLTPDDASREYERVFGMASAPEESKKRRRIA